MLSSHTGLWSKHAVQRKGGAEGKESSALSFEHKRLSFLSSLEILDEMGNNLRYLGENCKGKLKALSLRMSYEGLGEMGPCRVAMDPSKISNTHIRWLTTTCDCRSKG